jgi:hypothetical protein
MKRTMATLLRSHPFLYHPIEPEGSVATGRIHQGVASLPAIMIAEEAAIDS